MFPGVSVSFSSVKVFRNGRPVQDEQVEYVRDESGVPHCMYVNRLTGERRHCGSVQASHLVERAPPQQTHVFYPALPAPQSTATFQRPAVYVRPMASAAPPSQRFAALMPPAPPRTITVLPENVRVGPAEIEY